MNFEFLKIFWLTFWPALSGLGVFDLTPGSASGIFGMQSSGNQGGMYQNKSGFNGQAQTNSMFGGARNPAQTQTGMFQGNKPQNSMFGGNQMGAANNRFGNNASMNILKFGN